MPALSRSTRIIILLVLDSAFLLTELAVGFSVGSLALVADAFHMLNDVLSLLVALHAIRLSSRASDDRFTFGWRRAEIVAALVNGVFLLALCLSIALEAIGRFVQRPDVTNPKLVVIVGCLGLASNIFGLLLFHEHSHSHSHGPSEHGDAPMDAEALGGTPMDVVPSPSSDSNLGHPVVTRRTIVQAATDMAGPSSSEAPQDTEQTGTTSAPASSTSPRTEKTHGYSHAAGSMNMRVIVLHVLGDALGNVGVIGAGLVMWLSRWSGRFYLDPAVSLALSALICVSALPLVRGAAAVLLQAAPPGLVLADVRARIARAPGVRGVHELHVWQLSERALVASVHVRAARGRDFMATAAEIRARLHALGIHSCTIQPEYDDEAAPEKCLIACPPEAACEPTDACCPPPAFEA